MALLAAKHYVYHIHCCHMHPGTDNSTRNSNPKKDFYQKLQIQHQGEKECKFNEIDMHSKTSCLLPFVSTL